MAIHVALHHRSHYTYDRPVNHAPHQVRLRPAPHCRTPILSYSLNVLPKKHFINWQQDPFSNYIARLAFLEKTTELLLEVDLVAEMSVFNPFDFFLEPASEKFPFTYESGLLKELGPFLETTPLNQTPRFATLLASISREKIRTIDFLVNLNLRLSKEIKYLIRLEPGVQTPEETLTLSSGSCRDTSWLLVQLFRHLGLAARFVSGYLIQLTADVKSLDGPSGTEVDFTDLHAWCEVFLPGAGWVGLDPTSGLMAGEGHIPLACTPEPSSAAPISGAVDKCESVFTHTMKITRILETPRVTKPYTEQQWTEIESLGHQIDRELFTKDVRLTMGGEPTFISIDNMDGAEWNFTAVGPEKRKLSFELIQRLKERFGPGGLLHYGQGKWYPGESLPRWAYGCYWRKDGEKIWENEKLLAVPNQSFEHGAVESEKFINNLSRRLGLNSKWIMPGFEDAMYYLWKERSFPANLELQKAGLKDGEERARLAKLFSSGLDDVVGHVLPLQRGGESNQSFWISGPWFLKGERLYLIPGDSPMGLRLPLDSLPWVAAADQPVLAEIDPTAPRPELPTRAELQRQCQPLDAEAIRGPKKPHKEPENLIKSTESESAARSPARGESASWIIRTALCVESRGGCLHVFMPPVTKLEDYLEIICAIEATSAELQLPVVIEGYPPPHDHRVEHVKVTPDPGVIEVNLQPAHDWDHLVRNTSTLYEEARLARLGTEKFMIDGRHVGTGGGNHIVVGGATPADSPFLRRPDLLRSLVCYWQNHPSLSFLFSGLFIGPTSQHPRVDEARNDSLYELELAFKQIPDHGSIQPWVVDRIFRNLLIDVSGNTHRAEFCIDKLYSPDSSSGRLGLVELRAFEMPPHSRMSLTQQLLLRALIARFWDRPYQKPLVRWGTDLHDRFMLPHFVEQDFRDVIEDLRAHGYLLQNEWFAPHMEFRFPTYGQVTQNGVRLEIRQALEPWHVLGEEGAAGGAVRYVDSSVERLQVKVNEMTGSRHLVTCNRRALPLHPTGVAGEFVAGVRYRAWQPPECLHPTIGVHAPLVFDLLDSWNSRSLGGCTYYVSHPGGLSYSTLPINAYEAESRRLARFLKIGHTPGPFQTSPVERNLDFPLTLDLRHR